MSAELSDIPVVKPEFKHHHHTAHIIASFMLANELYTHMTTDPATFERWRTTRTKTLKAFNLWLKWKLRHAASKPTKAIWEYLNEAANDQEKGKEFAKMHMYILLDTPQEYWTAERLRRLDFKVQSEVRLMFFRHLDKSIAEQQTTKLNEERYRDIVTQLEAFFAAEHAWLLEQEQMRVQQEEAKSQQQQTRSQQDGRNTRTSSSRGNGPSMRGRR